MSIGALKPSRANATLFFLFTVLLSGCAESRFVTSNTDCAKRIAAFEVLHGHHCDVLFDKTDVVPSDAIRAMEDCDWKSAQLLEQGWGAGEKGLKKRISVVLCGTRQATEWGKPLEHAYTRGRQIFTYVDRFGSARSLFHEIGHAVSYCGVVQQLFGKERFWTEGLASALGDGHFLENPAHQLTSRMRAEGCVPEIQQLLDAVPRYPRAQIDRDLGFIAESFAAYVLASYDHDNVREFTCGKGWREAFGVEVDAISGSWHEFLARTPVAPSFILPDVGCAPPRARGVNGSDDQSNQSLKEMSWPSAKRMWERRSTGSQDDTIQELFILRAVATREAKEIDVLDLLSSSKHEVEGQSRELLDRIAMGLALRVGRYDAVAETLDGLESRGKASLSEARFLRSVIASKARDDVSALFRAESFPEAKSISDRLVDQDESLCLVLYRTATLYKNFISNGALDDLFRRFVESECSGYEIERGQAAAYLALIVERDGRLEEAERWLEASRRYGTWSIGSVLIASELDRVRQRALRHK